MIDKFWLRGTMFDEECITVEYDNIEKDYVINIPYSLKREDLINIVEEIKRITEWV